jgi:hypothetical protein
MAEDRANNSARVPEVGSSAIQKALEGKSNIAGVYGPQRRDMNTPGSGKWDFGGGRPRYDVIERTAEESGPREMIKFDKNNKKHVGLLTSEDDSNKEMMLHSGGYFSFPKKDGAAPKKKVSNLEKARAAEGVARKKEKVGTVAPVAGTAGAAKVRAAALAANEAKMVAVRKRLAENKKK